MQKVFLNFLVLILCNIGIYAQKLNVESFVVKSNDITARTNARYDNNKRACALVKVQLAASGAKFDGNIIGNIEYKTSEYWVYMPAGSKKLIVKLEGYLPKEICFDEFNVKLLESKCTYSLILTLPDNHKDQQIVSSQYLIFKVDPIDAIVEVDGTQWTNTNGTARKFVSFGDYTYTVQAKDYHPQSGKVTVNDPNQKVEVTVALKPAFGTLQIEGSQVLNGASVYVDNKLSGIVPLKIEKLTSGTHTVRLSKSMYKSLEFTVTIKDGKFTKISPSLEANYANVTLLVEDNAEIWINDELKGTGIWKGQLEYGDYKIETKKEGLRSQSKVYAITQSSNQQSIKLAGPVPFYGHLNISTQPDGADIIIDGKKAGTTPMFIQQIVAGKHDVEITKTGLNPYKTSVIVSDGKTTDIGGNLDSLQPRVIVLRKAVEKYEVNGVKFSMVYVEGGTFKMGSKKSSDEMPIHEVRLNSFSIGQTEVTQELWEAVMGANPSIRKGLKRPVDNVSWNDCQTFIGKLNKLTGQCFRLPTEAEWEYAARGGNISRGYTYSGSNNIAEVAWNTSNSDNRTHKVATKAPNELSIYDMSGNVWEWCQDNYDSRYYSSSSIDNPTGPTLTSSSIRVLRGGSWLTNAKGCRVAYRAPHNSSGTANLDEIGFRLALTIKKKATQ